MLDNSLTLKQMIDFVPKDEDMLSLPLDVVVYCKASIISLSKIDNYDFIRFLFTDEDICSSFKDIDKTIIYDFDGTQTNQEKYINIFELYSLYNFDNISTLLKETLEKYSHEADVIIDLYTHDSKQYRLSNLDGIVKLEEMKKATA